MSDVLLRLVPSIATAAVMAFVVAGLAILWPPNSSSQLLHLLLLILVGIVTYAGLTIMTQRPLLKNLIRAAFNR